LGRKPFLHLGRTLAFDDYAWDLMYAEREGRYRELPHDWQLVIAKA